MSENRKFRGIWIPKEIWLSKKLTLQEKLFFVEIDSLNDPEKGCFASNKYFAEFFGISEDRASVVICSLRDKKIIDVSVVKSSGKSTRKIVPLFEFTTTRKHTVGVHENTQWPLHGNTQYNNKDINNKANAKNIVDSVDGKEINEIISLFESVNVSYKRLFERKQERQAVQRLIKLWGKEKLKDTIQFLEVINAQPYAPVATTPCQLEEKAGRIKAFIDKKKNEKAEQVKGRAIIA